ncbi:MAG: hypothetical protein EXR21_10375 [Flavobacteriaceae bacterium]|nr:hypothetical protein [Flavobacteriaceae bacterium]
MNKNPITDPVAYVNGGSGDRYYNSLANCDPEGGEYNIPAGCVPTTAATNSGNTVGASTITAEQSAAAEKARQDAANAARFQAALNRHIVTNPGISAEKLIEDAAKRKAYWDNKAATDKSDGLAKAAADKANQNAAKVNPTPTLVVVPLATRPDTLVTRPMGGFGGGGGGGGGVAPKEGGAAAKPKSKVPLFIALGLITGLVWYNWK